MNPFTDPLPANSTDRLRAVAEVLRTKPDRWDQEYWVTDRENFTFSRSPLESIAAFGPIECGTNQACIAGWGLLLTPTDQLINLPDVERSGGWSTAGAAALGLQTGPEDWTENNMAYYLFRNELPLTNTEVADALDKLASIHESDRTWTEFACRFPQTADLIINGE